MKPTPTQIEAAFDAYLEGVYLTEDQAKASVIRIVTAALSVQPPAAVVGEPVAWMFEGVGWGKEVMLSHKEALERKERLSATWDITITPLYAAPSSPDGWQEAAHIGDAVLTWMVKYDLLDAGNEYRAEDVVSVLNDLTPSDVTAEVEQLRAENAKFRKALAKIAERADDNLPMYTPGAMVHTAEEALGGASHD